VVVGRVVEIDVGVDVGVDVAVDEEAVDEEAVDEATVVVVDVAAALASSASMNVAKSCPNTRVASMPSIRSVVNRTTDGPTTGM
jgi:hypothetical protein